jgi:hypothetical protein
MLEEIFNRRPNGSQTKYSTFSGANVGAKTMMQTREIKTISIELSATALSYVEQAMVNAAQYCRARLSGREVDSGLEAQALRRAAMELEDVVAAIREVAR